MGVITSLASLVGLVKTAGGVAETVIGHKGKLEREEHAEFIATLAQLSKEFEQPQRSWFDSLINGLNRLPRPALAIGTLGLFVYAMSDPISFAERMVGLELIPDPLWWLLGAIVSFYFGARELHYLRERRPEMSLDALREVTRMREAMDEMREDVPAPERTPARPGDRNPALEEWLRDNG